VQFRYNILFVGVAFAYHYATELVKTQMKSKELEIENADAKLALLKNQLNPHFLYNSLSLLYAKALPYSEELASLVGQISDILRYSLDEPLDETGKVAISKEIEHIKNYINIHSQRFDDKLKIDFEIKGNIHEPRIAPMLLITFIENAFKHGDFKAGIRFSLNVENGIEFISENTIGKIAKKHVGGIGIENIRKRLQLIYPQKHSLKIHRSENKYLIHLKIWDQ
jgi:LytS/YehU family sensor histidine kinase